MEFRIVMKYCTKPIKAREVPCNLFVSVEQLREALHVFICNLRQVIEGEGVGTGAEERPRK